MDSYVALIISLIFYSCSFVVMSLNFLSFNISNFLLSYLFLGFALMGVFFNLYYLKLADQEKYKEYEV